MKRKALAVSLILLLAISGALFLRLDPDKLSVPVQSQLQRWSGQKIRAGSASLSLLHGASLRIADVDMGSVKQLWHLHADSLRLGLSLWRLLQGEASIKSAEIIHPVLDFPKSAQIKDMTMMALPRLLKRIRIRQGRIRINGKPVVQGFDGTVRRLRGDQELTWELQTSLFGGDVTTQGRIRPAAREQTVFGKLKVRHIHLKDLSVFLPGLTLPRPAYDTFGTSLTFDVNAGRTWNLFGDANLHASRKNAPTIIWRGKVDGAGWQRLKWHDAFLQLGRNTMFSTAGKCAHGKGCHFYINTKNAEIPLLLKASKLNLPVRGKLNATSSFAWGNGQWSAGGKLTLHHISWSDIAMPDATLSVTDALYHDAGHVELANVRLQPAGAGGDMVLNRFAMSGKTWNLDAHIRNMRDAWAPLANILLKTHGISPDLRGQGLLNAEIHVSSDADHTGIDVSLDASQAQLAYAENFKKPVGVQAKVGGHVDTDEGKTTFSIHEMQLGSSHAADVQWMLEQGNIKSVATKNMYVDLTKLTQAGIVFPDSMKDWHGAIRGHFSRLRPSAKTGMPDWFAPSSAMLELDDFGAGNHHWKGLVNIHEGVLSTQNMLWKNTLQFARLSGNINLASLRGEANIQDAALSWKQGDALPAWLSRTTLHGHLHNVALNWMGNAWDGLHGAYRSRGKHITLKKMRVNLAGGSVQSTELSLVLAPESIHFSGPIRMAIVRLGKLEGLTGALGSNLNGYMYLNASLEGYIPWKTGSGWLGNGDIEIQHGHWQPVDQKLTLAAGDLRAQAGKSVSFSRFSARFHMVDRAFRLTRIQVESGAKQITGHAFLHPDGEIGGEVQIRDHRGARKSALIGNWPGLTALFGTK